jgi:hypothetical protein
VKFSRIHQISRSWYIDWDLLSRLNFDDLNWESIRGVNLAGCLLVSEVPETLLDVAESVVRAFARNLQLNISALHLLETEDAVEEYFVLHGTAQERFEEHFDPRSIWDGRVQRGLGKQNDPNGVSLLTDPIQADIDSIWELYVSNMQELSLSHPIKGDLDLDSFETLLRSPLSAAFVGRSDGAPLSLALMTMDMGFFEFLDPRWPEGLQSKFSPTTVVMCPGIVTARERRRSGLNLEVLALWTDIAREAHTNQTVIFPCNNVSRAYTPLIAQAACDLIAPDVSGKVELASRYIFSGYLLS